MEGSNNKIKAIKRTA
ncbi:hypothetical protein M0P68_10750 [Leuconostoc mesenteroides]|nr:MULTISPECIES: hypothetical protein [Leuconostoc]MCM6830359.1 hypothetical protein [Leuconostoc mesenteroides]MDV8928689.1 hypothetical protein [Leuconostoc mesenteroides]